MSLLSIASNPIAGNMHAIFRLDRTILLARWNPSDISAARKRLCTLTYGQVESTFIRPEVQFFETPSPGNKLTVKWISEDLMANTFGMVVTNSRAIEHFFSSAELRSIRECLYPSMVAMDHVIDVLETSVNLSDCHDPLSVPVLMTKFDRIIKKKLNVGAHLRELRSIGVDTKTLKRVESATAQIIQ
jgi:hypothetical protein